MIKYDTNSGFAELEGFRGDRRGFVEHVLRGEGGDAKDFFTYEVMFEHNGAGSVSKGVWRPRTRLPAELAQPLHAGYCIRFTLSKSRNPMCHYCGKESLKKQCVHYMCGTCCRKNFYLCEAHFDALEQFCISFFKKSKASCLLIERAVFGDNLIREIERDPAPDRGRFERLTIDKRGFWEAEPSADAFPMVVGVFRLRDEAVVGVDYDIAEKKKLIGGSEGRISDSPGLLKEDQVRSKDSFYAEMCEFGPKERALTELVRPESVHDMIRVCVHPLHPFPFPQTPPLQWESDLPRDQGVSEHGVEELKGGSGSNKVLLRNQEGKTATAITLQLPAEKDMRCYLPMKVRANCNAGGHSHANKIATPLFALFTHESIRRCFGKELGGGFCEKLRSELGFTSGALRTDAMKESSSYKTLVKRAEELRVQIVQLIAFGDDWSLVNYNFFHYAIGDYFSALKGLAGDAGYALPDEMDGLEQSYVNESGCPKFALTILVHFLRTYMDMGLKMAVVTPIPERGKLPFDDDYDFDDDYGHGDGPIVAFIFARKNDQFDQSRAFALQTSPGSEPGKKENFRWVGYSAYDEKATEENGILHLRESFKPPTEHLVMTIRVSASKPQPSTLFTFVRASEKLWVLRHDKDQRFGTCDGEYIDRMCKACEWKKYTLVDTRHAETRASLMSVRREYFDKKGVWLGDIMSWQSFAIMLNNLRRDDALPKIGKRTLILGPMKCHHNGARHWYEVEIDFGMAQREPGVEPDELDLPPVPLAGHHSLVFDDTELTPMSDGNLAVRGLICVNCDLFSSVSSGPDIGDVCCQLMWLTLHSAILATGLHREVVTHDDVRRATSWWSSGIDRWLHWRQRIADWYRDNNGNLRSFFGAFSEKPDSLRLTAESDTGPNQMPEFRVYAIGICQLQEIRAEIALALKLINDPESVDETSQDYQFDNIDGVVQYNLYKNSGKVSRLYDTRAASLRPRRARTNASIL